MNYCIKRGGVVELFEETKEKPRIPRPPNAFMLYANENRKKMSQLYPTESNKDISKRLGSGWKSLEEDERKKFFDRAKAIGLQHKKEYPDYVYNPKEARIRKAMRDATRERSIGTSPMLPRPNARRASSHSWVSPHDELLMQSSQAMGAMRGGGMPCPFPMQPGNQFMGMGSNGYSAKMEAGQQQQQPIQPSSSLHSNYMQSNPLAQLQQHTEMWPDYQTIRPRSSGNPFMMGADVFSQAPPELMMDKPPTTPTNSGEIITANEPDKTHGDLMDGNQATASSASIEPARQDPFMQQVFETTATPTNSDRHFDKIDENKVKKTVLQLPLSSQSLSSNLFSNDLKYQNNYILEHFQAMPSMTLMSITTPNGTTFPYATYSPSHLMDSVTNESKVFENVSEPCFFHTDVGFVPLSSM